MLSSIWRPAERVVVVGAIRAEMVDSVYMLVRPLRPSQHHLVVYLTNKKHIEYGICESPQLI